VGPSGIDNIETLINNTTPDYSNTTAAVTGIAVLLYAGLRIFMQLQKALNHIWKVETSKNTGFLNLIKQRMVSLGVMLAIGFIILASLIGTAILTFLGNWASNRLSADLFILISSANFVFSYLMITVLFTILHKLLPDVMIPWRFAFVGGSISALLYTIGQYGLSMYFKIAQPASSYGVMGSLILLMLWVSYSCIIFLYGAEITKVIFEYNHSLPVQPKETGKKIKN
jgi:membrane protein